jgi:radical SAM protein with 4Fe4S-binding SPASM domain
MNGEASGTAGGSSSAGPTGRRKHKYLLFEVTKSCQNNCQFCYNVWKEEPDYPAQELSLGDTLHLLDRVIEQVGCKHIGVTGGEPLLKPHIFEILAHMASRGVEPVLISNGCLLDENAVKKCLDYGCKYFEVSLHSNSEAIHDNLSGRPGNFQEVIDGIMNVKKSGGHVTTVFVATKENVRTFKDTVEVNALLGVEWMLFNRIACGGACISAWRRMVPSPQDIREALDTGVPVAERYRVGLSAGVQIQPCLVDLSQYKTVYSGFCPLNDPLSESSYFAIDPAGNLRMCNRSKTILGNLLDRPFHEIAGGKAVAEVAETFPEFCRDCQLALTCGGGCKADALSSFGTLSKPDPYVEMFKDQVKKIQ